MSAELEERLKVREQEHAKLLEAYHAEIGKRVCLEKALEARDARIKALIISLDRAHDLVRDLK